MRRFVWVLATLLGSAPVGVEAQGATPSPTAARLYQEVGSRILKVELTEIESDAPASVGTGFFVSESGAFVTNFHVVAEAIYEPESYSLRLVDADDVTRTGQIVSVDPVHDLAILSVEYGGDGFFELADTDASQGDPLFSLGHPLDLDLSIVEGIYNGLLRNALYPRIHFTGSVNSGMSGGPAINEEGRVVGVNVATAGNQLSFLVPVSYAKALYDETAARNLEPEPDFLLSIEERMVAHQSEYLGRIVANSFPTVRIGGFEAPSDPAEFFDCSSSIVDPRDIPYEATWHQCFTQDQIFLSEELIFGIVDVYHQQIRSDSLSARRFSTLYNGEWAAGQGQVGFKNERVTEYRCDDGRIDNGAHTLVTLFCARRYVDFPRLYDVFVRSATVDAPDRGLVSYLTMNGVEIEGARDVARLFLERIR